MAARRLLTIREAADRLAVSPDTVRRLVAVGALPSVRFSERGQHRFASDDVDALIERGRRVAS